MYKISKIICKLSRRESTWDNSKWTAVSTAVNWPNTQNAFGSNHSDHITGHIWHTWTHAVTKLKNHLLYALNILGNLVCLEHSMEETSYSYNFWQTRLRKHNIFYLQLKASQTFKILNCISHSSLWLPAASEITSESLFLSFITVSCNSHCPSASVRLCRYLSVHLSL